MALAMQHLYRLVANAAGAADNSITCDAVLRQCGPSNKKMIAVRASRCILTSYCHCCRHGQTRFYH